MVMTTQIRPGLSVRGLALVGAVGLAAYLATPLLACPPADKRPAKATKEKPPKPPLSYKLLVPAAPLAVPTPRAAPAAPGPEPAATTFERFMRDREGRDRKDMSLEERLGELEREIDQLYRELERLPGATGGRGSGGAGIAFAVPRADIQAPLGSVLGSVVGAPDKSQASGNCLGSAATMGGETVTRVYRLSEGKLDALVSLMVREDVPILVRPLDNGIEVHASPAQHCIFELFCKLIDGKDQVKAHVLPAGKLEALTELMVRGDVPILVEPGSERIGVHGTDVEQAVFDAFCTLINPPEATGSAARASYARALEAMTDRSRAYEAAAVAQMAQIEGLKSTLRAFENQLRTFERQADRKRDRAEQLAEKAQECQEEAEEFVEEAQETDRQGRRQTLLARAESLRARGRDCAAQADALEREADALALSAAQIEDQIEEIEYQISDLEEAIEDDEDDDWDN